MCFSFFFFFSEMLIYSSSLLFKILYNLCFLLASLKIIVEPPLLTWSHATSRSWTLLLWTLLNVNFSLTSSSTNLKIYPNNLDITKLQQLHLDFWNLRNLNLGLQFMLQEGLEELLCLYKKHNSSKILKKCALGFLLYLGLKTMKPWVKMAS